jgi:3-methyladenine DNA glycosylase Tag
MEQIRCGWCTSSDLYKKYHDEEWGVPVYDDPTLFEFLILETFQAGLSWITILKKRGFKFVGSTVIYAHMQATGMVNDHAENCWKRVQ